MYGFSRNVLRLLPSGQDLPQAAWMRRHEWISILVWLHVLAIPLYGLARDVPIEHSLVAAAVVAVFGLGAGPARLPRALREAMATVGLMAASALLLHVSGGQIELHAHFFVMVVVISLYQSGRPFLVALTFMFFHYAFVGVLDTSAAYNHPAVDQPLTWGLMHGSFILGQAAACVVGWRAYERVVEGETRARKALERATSELADAQLLSNLGSWEWDLATDTMWWSDGLYSVLQLTPGSVAPSWDAFIRLVHQEDRPRVTAIVEAAKATSGRKDYECRITRADGAVRTIHVLGQRVLADNGASPKVVGTCQDITERKMLEREIEHRALHDSLTGLGNRALFLGRLEHALAKRRRTPAQLALLYIDIDEFKAVNDTLGHDAGDRVLVEIGKRIRSAVRSVDTVARLGGDEFAVLLEDFDAEAAQLTAVRVTTAVQQPIAVGGKELTITASIGIALADDVTSPPDLLRDADIAMYAAKRAGKGAWQMFDPEMLTSTIARTELNLQLREAVQQGQFVLHYQPVVNLDTGELQSVEALVRWNHPDRGILPPDEFIALAEQTGLIVPLGAWVTNQAIEDIRKIQDALGAPVSMSVNLSAHQLGSDVVTMVSKALEAADVAPHHLVLELTETCLMTEDAQTAEKLEALRDLGVRIAIDDFGTGYSSLSYLTQLPIDILKIDRSFVTCITEGPEEAAVAQAIIRLARTFELGTIAEGIETPEQATAVQSFGCAAGQGFLFCRPVGLEQLLEDPTWQSAGDSELIGTLR